ncbi:EAL domain-containing protein [Photobacterium angustum]|uniref:EAL domain-containing protein n=1 Tax=Photobacterium angustum TaxID=661 RepID=UPI0005EA0DD2|nr:EAL domain-containing protein [Photobacterium angustum]KJG02640.1 diguanylate phosphodiesterase [Photobacterium angustum]PSV68489.1 EAL domain-containing protein [Photobacterium angustum]
MKLKRLSFTFFNFAIGFMTFAIVIILVTLSSQKVSTQLFKSHLRFLENQRFHAYINEIKTTSILLDNLQYHLSYTCDKYDITELEKISYYSPQIASIQLTTNSGKKCSDHRDISSLYLSPLKRISLDPQITLIENRKNNQSIIKYNKKLIGGSVIVDIVQQPTNPLLANLPQNSWLQMIEGNQTTLFTGDPKSAISKIFSNKNISSDIQNIIEPILTMSLNNKTWLKYYSTPTVINTYRAQIQPYLLLLLALFTSAFIFLCYRRYHSASIIKFLVENAIKQNHLIPYYQAIVDANKQQICGYEVLIRWETKKGKVIFPDEFIPQCEANGVITPLTFQLINTVAKDIRKLEMLDQGKPLPYYFSINLSASVIQDPKLVEITRNALQHYKVKAHNLAFELTERAPIKDIELASHVCQKLNDMGIQIKLDDVGNGYCDFLALQKLQATTIKIDKIFIDELDCNNKNSIVSSLVAFADKAEVEVVVEGVETTEQAECLLTMGIHYHQGFLYSKPQPFTNILKIYQSKNVI